MWVRPRRLRPSGRTSEHGRQRRLGHRERAELGVEFARVEATARDRPVARGELKEALPRPVGHDAEDVSEVQLGIELVQTR